MAADAGKEEFRKRNEDFGAIDVATLMALVTLKTPEVVVTVKGIVEALRPSSKIPPTTMYGDLRSVNGRSTMSFQCPFPNAPRLKEHIIFRGTVKSYKSDVHRGFDFELTGEKVGELTLTEPAAVPPISLNRIRSKLTLERFVSKEVGKKLVLIGTKTAIDDARETLYRGTRQSLDTRECTTGLSSLQTVIAETAQKYDGLCLMRGGGESESFATWNDSRLIEVLIDCGKPFYVALGHSRDLTLADKYADDCFANPSDFSSAYIEAWKAHVQHEKLKSELEVLKRSNQELKSESQDTRREGFRRNMDGLQTAVAELQRLPAIIGKQSVQSISSIVSTSIQNDFRKLTETAVKESIANLNQAADTARNSMAKMMKVSRFHSWTWLFSIFLLGALAGSFGYHFIAQSKIDSIQEELRTIQQQTATSPAPESKPVDSKLAKGHRGR